MKSIIPGDTEFCFLCHKMGIFSRGTEVHHMIFGTANRKLADKDMKFPDLTTENFPSN